ncbi:MAG: class I SAM-dependent methyltransferase [Polyangiaceae bacterium]
MKNRPSLTASLVALARGVASRTSTMKDAPTDPFARDLLPLPFALLHRAIEATATRVPILATAWNPLFFGLIDHMALRTALIDDALREAIALGAEQLVIMGAGLDARAYRMPELRTLTTFEVDHPATQTYKLEKLGERTKRTEKVHFVAVDFEHGSIDDSLAAAGHDPSRKTFWVWEGVTMYLHLAATRATLAAMAARSSPGSRVVITYLTPESTLIPAHITAGDVVLRVIGEPLRGRLSVSDMRDALAESGFDVVRDTSAADWAERYGDGPLRTLHIPSRLVIAERR